MCTSEKVHKGQQKLIAAKRLQNDLMSFLWCFILSSVSRFGEILPLLQNFKHFGRKPWYSGYGRRLMFQRSWVQILAPYAGWT